MDLPKWQSFWSKIPSLFFPGKLVLVGLQVNVHTKKRKEIVLRKKEFEDSLSLFGGRKARSSHSLQQTRMVDPRSLSAH